MAPPRNWISWTKAAWFAGGIAAAGAATLASKSPSVHKAAVNVVAKGLAVNDCIQNATQTIMDDADDLHLVRRDTDEESVWHWPGWGFERVG